MGPGSEPAAGGVGRSADRGSWVARLPCQPVLVGAPIPAPPASAVVALVLLPLASTAPSRTLLHRPAMADPVDLSANALLEDTEDVEIGTAVAAHLAV